MRVVEEPVTISGHGLALRALAVLLGLFFLSAGLGKIGWYVDTAVLTHDFELWMKSATAANRWYLESFAIPGTPVFARVVPTAEIATGLALLSGVWMRLAASLAVLMVLNIHFASGALFVTGFLTNGYGLPVLSGLVALAIGAIRLPYVLGRP